MVAEHLFVLGWRPIGSSKRRWQVHACVNATEAARLVAGLARGDGGGRWRVYGTESVVARDGSVRVERRGLLHEGVVRSGAR